MNTNNNYAPEKLYLLPNGLISYCRNTDENVEYIRTDAFIEKAVNWLMLQEEMIGVSFQEDFIERFRKYMKG